VPAIIGLLLVIIALLLVLIILLVGGTSLLGWVLVGIIGAGVVAIIVLWINWSEVFAFVGTLLVVSVVVIGVGYLFLEGMSYLVPTWFSNWLSHLWGMSQNRIGAWITPSFGVGTLGNQKNPPPQQTTSRASQAAPSARRS
jgi:hypothetical protein